MLEIYITEYTNFIQYCQLSFVKFHIYVPKCQVPNLGTQAFMQDNFWMALMDKRNIMKNWTFLLPCYEPTLSSGLMDSYGIFIFALPGKPWLLTWMTPSSALSHRITFQWLEQWQVHHQEEQTQSLHASSLGRLGSWPGYTATMSLQLKSTITIIISYEVHKTQFSHLIDSKSYGITVLPKWILHRWCMWSTLQIGSKISHICMICDIFNTKVNTSLAYIYAPPTFID